jgi:hypothetical protein
MVCDWYVGGAETKTGQEVAMSSTKIDLPVGMKLPLGTPYSPPEPVLPTQAPLVETQPTAEATSTAVTTTDGSETVWTAAAAASAINIDCHGVSWIKHDTATHTDVNGSTQPRNWHVRDVIGNMHCAGSDPNSNFLRKDYFLVALPVAAINHFIACTLHELSKRKKNTTNWTETLRFFRCILLASWFDFGS